MMTSAQTVAVKKATAVPRSFFRLAVKTRYFSKSLKENGAPL